MLVKKASQSFDEVKRNLPLEPMLQLIRRKNAASWQNAGAYDHTLIGGHGWLVVSSLSCIGSRPMSPNFSVLETLRLGLSIS
jgi:hypothetical protein